MSYQADTDAGGLVPPPIVEAIAQRVAELLRAALDLTPNLLTPAEVADRFAVSRTWDQNVEHPWRSERRGHTAS